MKWNDADAIAFRLGLMAGQHTKVRAERRPAWVYQHWLVTADGNYQWEPPKDHTYPPTGRTFELNKVFFDENVFVIDEWVEDAGYEFVYGDKITREEAIPLRIVDALYSSRKVKKTLTEAFCRHQFREAGYGLA